MKREFEGKVALITGAAHGIGRGIAMVLAGYGATVVIADIQVSQGEKVVEEIRSSGGKASFQQVDLLDEGSIRNLIDRCEKDFQRLDILINNAKPRLKVASFSESLEEWDFGMNVLLKAPALASSYAFPLLRKSGEGCIVNMVSSNSSSVSHQPAVYHVAKAGLVQLTRFLACEFGSMGVRVNAVSPALVDIHDDGRPLTGNPLHKKVVEVAVPLRRAASVEEIGEAVAFLCSPRAGYVNGEVLAIDGGVTLRDVFHVGRESFLRKE